MQKIILHFDMNSYFASVEQQANPWLRGKPVGVVATMTPNGCIIASSIEAKKVGIKTGCRVIDAKKLYPKVNLVEVDPPKYRSTTKKIFSICSDYTEDIEEYSIDEAFLDLTGTVETFEQAKKIGKKIQQRIKDEVGIWLKCSIGIAETRWLAKFAGDTAPKGGIVILNKNNLYSYLKGMDLQEAWGIATATAVRLNLLGIYTLDQLADYPVQNLMSSMGVRGYYLWANVNGIEIGNVEVKRLPKSIGHSHVLRKNTKDKRFHQAILMRLCERTGRRLREKKLEAHGIYFYTNLEYRGQVGGSKKVHQPIISTAQIYEYAWEELSKYLNQDRPRFFAVGLFRIGPRVNQLSFFEDKRMSPVLSKALDDINNRYGEEMIVQGMLLKLGKIHAPDRIGFRKTMKAEFDGISNSIYKAEE
ncbi:MAG: DNA polymerase Y family protein [Candidatus Kerfeldbacteria bacterium]